MSTIDTRIDMAHAKPSADRCEHDVRICMAAAKSVKADWRRRVACGIRGARHHEKPRPKRLKRGGFATIEELLYACFQARFAAVSTRLSLYFTPFYAPPMAENAATAYRRVRLSLIAAPCGFISRSAHHVSTAIDRAAWCGQARCP
ncbi:hypothetical protein [uncultured Ralstonia sp.]|jgi:hypothetical protein|uniref:hypothetical protein n=1 Tax=Ralstonia sp. TaxID=54061 RepID=UPI0025D842EC|nr:hypothetical protein [uncultured Ralstonia sp.]